MRRVLFALLVVAAGCAGDTTPSPAASNAPSAGRAPAANADNGAIAPFSESDPGAVAGGPGAHARYGIGAKATASQVALWNRDVGPDGAELPDGRGTVAEGEQLYRAKCLVCHNTHGQGMPPLYPALIGRDSVAEGFRFASDPSLVKTIGNYWPNATTVFDYVRRAMPLTQPGSLNDHEVYALTAFLLASNNVIPKTTTLDASALRAVRMPYADRFVRDNRRGGPEVR